MVEPWPSKPVMRVRFPSSALPQPVTVDIDNRPEPTQTVLEPQTLTGCRESRSVREKLSAVFGRSPNLHVLSNPQGLVLSAVFREAKPARLPQA